MRLLCAGLSETGPVKSVNQDSYLMKRAQVPQGDVALVVVADGMSGLEKGEVASAEVVRAFDRWFQRDLPLAGESLGLRGPAFARTLEIQWANLLQEVNLSLMQQGFRASISLGAACTVFLVTADTYYVMQVGDTRLYRVASKALQQLTEDQTFAAQEVIQGRLSEEEAQRHPLRNTLLQCVGASKNLNPVFSRGVFDAQAIYVVCSDGFYRSLTDTELVRSLGGVAFSPLEAGEEGVALLKDRLRALMDTAFARGQRDNASAVVLMAAAGEEDISC